MDAPVVRPVEDSESALALLLSAARGAQACGYGAEDTERLVGELAAQLGLSDVQVSSLDSFGGSYVGARRILH